MSLLRRIKEYCHVMTNKPLCHPELFDKGNKRKFELCEPVPRVAGSQGQEILNQVQNDNVFNTLSYRANEVRCGIFKNLKKAFAFTLAETLIVMGIIGVVAALTIPNLNSSTADKEKVAKLNKIYSNLEDAMGRAQAVYGPFDEWFQTDTTATAQATRFGERVTEFMKPTKNCKTDTNSACWKIGSGGESDSETNSCYKFINADGSSMSLCRVVISSGGTSSDFYGAYVDVDGPNKGSNGIGDQFMIRIANSGELTPHDLSYDGGSYSYLSSCSSGTAREVCTSWTLRFGNMDYLKSNCKKTLDGTTNTSCK